MTDPIAEFLRAVRAGNLESLAGVVPYADFIGIRAEVTHGELITTMKYSDHLIGNPQLPALHGGALGGLLESAALLTVAHHVETDYLPKIVTFTVDYLRSAEPRDTFAHGTITRRGGRVCNVHVTGWQSSRSEPIVSANAHFLIKSKAPPSGAEEAP